MSVDRNRLSLQFLVVLRNYPKKKYVEATKISLAISPFQLSFSLLPVHSLCFPVRIPAESPVHTVH